MKKISISRKIIKCGYLGSVGTYTHIAASRKYNKKAKLIGYKNFKLIFQALKQEKVDVACLPYYNTVAGVVPEVKDLQAKYKFKVVAKYKLRVFHKLLVSPKNKLDILRIKKIFAHPHTFLQCQNFLKKYSYLKAIPVLSNSLAASLLKKQKIPSASIGPRQAAKEYGLKIANLNIMDAAVNHTDFIFITKKWTSAPLKKSSRHTKKKKN